MRLDPRAMAYTMAALWGGAVLIVGLAHIVSPDYGSAFLEMCASVYPGYQVQSNLSSVLIGTGYGLMDGAIAGWLFAWLYNRASCAVNSKECCENK